MDNILVIIVILFATGILCSSIFIKISYIYFFIVIFFCFIFSIIATLKNWNKLKFLIAIDFLFLGILYGYIGWKEVYLNPLKGLDNLQVTMDGVVEGDMSYKNDKTYFDLKIYKFYTMKSFYSMEFKVKVSIPGREDVMVGDRLKVKGILIRPPIVGNPGEFSYRDYLLRQGIHYILYIKSIEDIQRIGYEDESFIPRLSTIIKRKCVEIISSIMPPTEASLLAGIIFGTRANFSEKLLADFQTTGTLHIVAASGSNICSVIIVVIFICQLFKLSRKKSAILCIPVVILYAFMVGAQPSIIRASIMSIIVLLGLILGRESEIYTSLFASGFLILILEPLQIYDIGFQLSFVSVISIVYFTPVIDSFLSFIPLKEVRECLAASIAAQLGVAPIGIYYFNQISLISVVANLLIFLLAGFSLTLGIPMIFLYIVFPFLGIMIGRVVQVLLELFISIVSLLAQVPYASVNISTPQLCLILLYYILICSLFYLFKNYEKWKEYFKPLFTFSYGKIAIISSIIIFVIIWYPILFPSFLEVVFLDVAQGDAILLKLPDGKIFLIDGGRGGKDNSYDSGKSIIVPYLRRQGVNQIEGIFLSHSDNDHVGGLLSVFKEFRVKYIYDGFDFDPSNKVYSEFLKLVSKNGTCYYRLQKGDNVVFKYGVKVEVLNPCFPLLDNNKHINDNSLVLRVFWKNISFLMTGDTGINGETRLLEENLPLASYILKVSHHGSDGASSKDFLQMVKPSVAIISVGKNSYGHPSPDVLKRLKEVGAFIYRTDEYGAITILTDGKNCKILTIKEPKK